MAEDVIEKVKKASELRLGALEPGAYRLTLVTEDVWGGEAKQSVILLAVDPKAGKVPLKISALAIPEHTEYAVGEDARMLIGSSELDALTHVEIWGGRFLLERRALDGGGVRVLRLPLTQKHKGGVTVRWFGVEDFKPRAGQRHLVVVSYLLQVASQVYRCALFIYASEGVVPGPYDQDMMDLAWKVKS